MNHSLLTGILELDPGWQILLSQLGIAWRRIDQVREIEPATYAVIIVNRFLSPMEVMSLEKYVRNGGAILDNGEFLQKSGNSRVKRRPIGTIFPESSDQAITDMLDILDVFTTVNTLPGARYLKNTVDVRPAGNGWIGFVGFDISRLLTDTRSRRKQFYANTPRFPSEIVATVTKGALLRIVRNVLKTLFFKRGLPYVYRWYFPGDFPNVFTFRIDSDDSRPEQVDAFFEAANRYGIKMTWFLHGEAHEGWFSHFRNYQAQGHEMAVHGYRHATYPTAAQNRHNIARCQELLDREGLTYEGFASPYGFWNTGLARAIADAGFTYSSEFSLSYDALPFYPNVEGDVSPVLQVPVHPVCIGSLIVARATDAQMQEYFTMILRQKLASQEPICLYDHPRHTYRNVLENMFQQIGDRGVPNMTMGEYARWWKHREAVEFRAEFQGKRLKILSHEVSPMHRLAVQFSPEHYALIEKEGEYSQDILSWRQLPDAPTVAKKKITTLRRLTPRFISYHLFAAWQRWKKMKDER